jgi:hypothetical protein
MDVAGFLLKLFAGRGNTSSPRETKMPMFGVQFVDAEDGAIALGLVEDVETLEEAVREVLKMSQFPQRAIAIEITLHREEAPHDRLTQLDTDSVLAQ